jgi:hypothetical protein
MRLSRKALWLARALLSRNFRIQGLAQPLPECPLMTDAVDKVGGAIGLVAPVLRG